MIESLLRMGCLTGAGYLLGGWRGASAAFLIGFVAFGALRDFVQAQVKIARIK